MHASLELPPSVVGGGFFLGNEDQIRLTVYNALAGVRVTIAGRIVSAEDATVSPFEYEVTPTSDRLASIRTGRLSSGWLLSVHVYASAGSPLIGQTFAIASIVRGSTGAVVELATLAAGYITGKQRIAWPNSPIVNSLDGAGALRKIAGTNPAAGAEIVEVVPTGARWLLLAIKFLITTSAVAGNRAPTITIDDGNSANYYMNISSTATTAASLAHTWYYAAGIIERGRNQAFPPGIWLPSGHRWMTTTTAIDVGDQYSAIHYVVREWLEGN
jgi:hypothetical protein